MPGMPKIYKEDERPIKPMKNNNFMNSGNPFGLSENNISNNNDNYNNASQKLEPN